MKITVLGSGTSIGVPQIGCTCAVCTSSDAKDKRMRCSSLVETADARILIDCTPDFRQQMLGVPYDRLDGVLITHEHYDHTGGIDDLRPFCHFGGSVKLYLDSYTANHLRERLPYFFRSQLYPGVAHISLCEVKPYETFTIGATRIKALPVMHSKMPILGYRIDCPSGASMGYITDMSSCDEQVPAWLRGVDVLLVNALRFEPHPAHQTVEDAIRFAHKVGAGTTRLIHFSHDIGLHEKTNALLPQGIGLAYDGEVLEW